MSDNANSSAQDRLYDLARMVSDGLWETDAEGNFSWISDRIFKIFGKPAQAVVGRGFSDLLGTDIKLDLKRSFREITAEYVNVEGKAKHLLITGVPVFQPLTGDYAGARGVIEDVTARVEAAAEIQRINDELEQRVHERTEELEHENADRRRAESRLKIFSEAVEQSPASVIITGLDGNIDYVNQTFSRLTGYSREEALGRNPSFLQSGHTPDQAYAEMWRTLGDGTDWKGEVCNRTKGGQMLWLQVSISPIRDADGQTTNFIGVGEDITERKAYEQQLLRQANYDSLTGLPNRVLLQDRLNQALKQAHRESLQVGLLFIDLDNFKHVNDSLGHDSGDKLVQMAAQRIAECLREGDTVARFGGDEFAVVLPAIKNPMSPETVASKINSAFEKAFTVNGESVFTTASVGITLYPDDGQNAQVLMKNADSAMYAAKRSGRNTFTFFTPEMNEKIKKRVMLESHLRHALEGDEFAVHYQPLVDTRSNKVQFVEALIRWQNPVLGMVTPDQFIPLAEDTGLILPIGAWVLERACSDIHQLNKDTGSEVNLAVNISTRQFRAPDFAEMVENVLNTTGFEPERLELEITESLLFEDVESVQETIQQIKDLGVCLSLDDFGTGYSSLSYLDRFPFSTIKVDRSFMPKFDGTPNDGAIVKAIVSLAHSLGKTVVGEGVETEDQLSFLEDLGCDLYQGFFYAPPTQFANLAALCGKGEPVLRTENH